MSTTGTRTTNRPNKTTATSVPITRIYTTPGTHPYDDITWETRDVIQKNWKTGELIFEQNNVEFPDFWSENASTIVTTKYFRGAQGTPAREHSLKQLIDRIVNTYTAAAREHGYITNDNDLEIFDHELKYMLVHQIFAFNSPVWFNVGTNGIQQVSACYILAVDDTIDSILNWYKEEGLIFKGGSGAGVNLSRIRSHKELLRSSGGTASGPVSFMRGADASAGTIKSGGACLAPWTQVYTGNGPIEVEQLANANEEFLTFGWNATIGKIQANKSRAFLSGQKQLFRITTDKGVYAMSADHPVLMATGQYTEVHNLTPGMVIRPGVVRVNSHGLPTDMWSETNDDRNHTIETIEPLATENVYDVQVFNNTPEDRTEHDGHNFLIVSDSPTVGKELHGIFVHNSRRAAKMVVLDVDHPDIEDFIQTKAHEEKKIRALRDAGFNMDLDGDDITSVQYQNANNSVRVSDTFMTAVRDGRPFDLTARLDGSTIETVDARTLFRKMSTAAWECADPGIQYADTINSWHTNSNTGPITASNPCVEFVSLDNASCNLSSLNLMKFRNDDGTFDIDRFTRVVELVITAMEISVAFGDFPTKKIENTTRKFRQLGIGYANLGALLMAAGLPYDSPEGRSYAAAITALMTAVAYRRSAEIAAVVGPYEGYAENVEPHTRVMERHRDATNTLLQVLSGDESAVLVEPGIVTAFPHAVGLVEAAVGEWKRSLRLGKVTGWRNSQASLLAPTGTIGFVLDCDTTGIEPDFSLIKHKKLVGGGSLKYVNGQVPLALETLGYAPTHRTEIEAFISEFGHVVGAPGLDETDYAVFDCAVGERAIAPNGHISMMAAAQPFLSGAISKTVNLPESVTVEDIEEVYYRGWELGLKAIAVYRDNCKVGQPLSDGKAPTAVAGSGGPQVIERIVEKIVERPKRTKLPLRRTASTTSFRVGEVSGYLTIGEYEDGTPGEVFIKMSKQGSTLAGIMDALSMSISIALQYGVPVETFVEKFANTRFEPAGMTNDTDIRMAQSVMDYIVRRLALDYLSFETRAALGIYTAAERTAALTTGVYEPVVVAGDVAGPSQDEIAPELPHDSHDGTPGVPASVDDGLPGAVRAFQMDPPLCPTCGSSDGMKPTGSCWACQYDGTTLGCS